MAKHIYVSSVVAGGASGDTSYVLQQTGNITGLTSTNVYNTIEDAVLGATPTDGDFIYCADNHAASYALSANLAIGGGTTGGIGMVIMSVDNTSIADYLSGAAEINTSSNDFQFYGMLAIIGVDIKGDDDVFSGSGVGSGLLVQDATLTTAAGNGDLILRMAGSDGVRATFNDVDVVCGSAIADLFAVSIGGRFTWNGGALSGTSPENLFVSFGGGGGAYAEVTGVDLSILDGVILPNQIAGSADNTFCKLQSCQLHPDLTLPVAVTNLETTQNRFEMYNCDDSTGDTMHRLYIADGAGMVRNQDNTYIDADTAWFEGTDKSSYEISTSAICSYANPFAFEVPTQYIDLGDTGSDKVFIDIVIDTAGSFATLKTADFNVFLIYPDGTTKTVYNSVNNVINPTGTGSELNKTGALVAGDWTGEPASPEFYRVYMDTSGDAGEAFGVIVRVEVYKASIAWGELFIGSELGAE